MFTLLDKHRELGVGLGVGVGVGQCETVMVDNKKDKKLLRFYLHCFSRTDVIP